MILLLAIETRPKGWEGEEGLMSIFLHSYSVMGGEKVDLSRLVTVNSTVCI